MFTIILVFGIEDAQDRVKAEVQIQECLNRAIEKRSQQGPSGSVDLLEYVRVVVISSRATPPFILVINASPKSMYVLIKQLLETDLGPLPGQGERSIEILSAPIA